MNENQAYDEALSERAQHWRTLDEHTKSHRRDKTVAEAREVLDGYRTLAGDLSIARRQLSGSTVHRALEALFVQIHGAIHYQRRNPWRELVDLFTLKVPRAARMLAAEILTVTLLFVAAYIAGYFMVVAWPNTASWFMSEHMMLLVQNQQLWTDDLLNVIPSSMLSIDLMTNNISVALTAFALGLIYGIGTLYIISLNGLMLGAVFAYTTQYSMAMPLFKFIVAHGIVELSVICLAGAAGMALGKALARPGPGGRMQSVREVASDAGALAAVCVPFLIGSGLIEGYVSPNDNFELLPRVIIGVLWFGVLLATLCGFRKQRNLGSMGVSKP